MLLAVVLPVAEPRGQHRIVKIELSQLHVGLNEGQPIQKDGDVDRHQCVGDVGDALGWVVVSDR